MNTNGRSQLNPALITVAGTAGGNTTYTRPADTTAYAALDSVSDSTSAPNVITFTGILRNVIGTGYITKAKLTTSQSTNTARFRLHLWNAAVSAINDNAAWTLLIANVATYQGFIDFGPCGTEGSGSDMARAINVSGALPVVGGATANLFGLLETLDAFTPASAQTFRIELTLDPVS